MSTSPPARGDERPTARLSSLRRVLPGPLASAAARLLPEGFLDRLTERQMTWLVLLIGALLYIPLAAPTGCGTHGRPTTPRSRADGRARRLHQPWWPGAPLDADHFWSKPVLSFWIMSLSMRLFGIAAPSGTGALALGARAEWATRLPFCLMGVLGIYAVYLCVSRFVSRRAGLSPRS